MNVETSGAWHEANQRYLLASLAAVLAALERHAAGSRSAPGSAGEDAAARPVSHEPGFDAAAPPALESLCGAFALSPFERDVLLLCAGMELDSRFAACCAEAQGDPRRPYPTFSLALAALPEAHWSALAPIAPLRRWRLVEMAAGETLTSSRLGIDERVLHYLAGVPYLDERMQALVERVPPPMELPPSHCAPAERIHGLWSEPEETSRRPAVQLCGEDHAGKRAVAAAACAALGLELCLMPAAVLPLDPAEVNGLIRLWEREAVLSASALFLDCDEVDMSDAPRERTISQVIETTRGPLIVAARQRWRIRRRPCVTLDVHKPTASEQREIWQGLLGAEGPRLDGQVDALVSQFSLSAQAIHAARAEALGQRAPDDPELQASLHGVGDLLWDACRAQTRPRLDDLAQRVAPASTWDDLVLPEPQLETLRDIAVQVRQRLTVYETWGFAQKSARGLGISTLFAGASGTGKTMAAEVLANELRLDLHRIDLSSVVSKYIGETEKNLRRVFDAAEEGGSILLFDEADALFGKRGEVKDSHDRYANIEVSYLLQRMEAYRGLAILTTNMKSALDPAFLRRIRFVLQFPFPDAAQRAEIWRRVFPPNTPTDGLDVGKLSRLNVAGGNIFNIALNAAFLAADDGRPVSMTHVLRAARSEYAKLEKPLTDGEIAGWV